MRISGWSQNNAIELCKSIEPIAVKHGGHIALTGGLLYKTGVRKDLDILVYPVRGGVFNWDGFFAELKDVLGIEQGKDSGWCKKATSDTGRHIDFFDPMSPDGEHNSGEVTEDEDFLA